MRTGIACVMMDEKGDQRCQDGLERVWEVSGWIRKGIRRFRLYEKGYWRCEVG